MRRTLLSVILLCLIFCMANCAGESAYSSIEISTTNKNEMPTEEDDERNGPSSSQAFIYELGDQLATDLYLIVDANGNNKTYGLAKADGTVLLHPEYRTIFAWTEDRFTLHNSLGAGICNKKGEILCWFSPIDESGAVEIAVYEDEKQWAQIGFYGGGRQHSIKGYIDKNGEYIINPMYIRIEWGQEDIARVEVAETGKWGVIDTDGEYVIQPKYDYIKEFSEGLAYVQENGLYGFINKDEDYVVPLQYEDAHSFYNGLAAVKIDGKWGYIDKSGGIVIKPAYDRAGSFKNNFAIVYPYYRLCVEDIEDPLSPYCEIYSYAVINLDGQTQYASEYKLLISSDYIETFQTEMPSRPILQKGHTYAVLDVSLQSAQVFDFQSWYIVLEGRDNILWSAVIHHGSEEQSVDVIEWDSSIPVVYLELS